MGRLSNGSEPYCYERDMAALRGKTRTLKAKVRALETALATLTRAVLADHGPLGGHVVSLGDTCSTCAALALPAVRAALSEAER